METTPSRPAAGASHYPAIVRDARGRSRILTTPPLNRTPMAPLPWQRTLLQRLFGGRRYAAATVEAPDPRGFWWHRVAVFRRFCLLALVICQTVAATNFMGSVLPYQGRDEFHGIGAALPGPRAARDRDPGAVRGALRVDIRRFLDGDGRLRDPAARR